MLGFFPKPYPDELLYSVCARYAKRVKYPNKQSAVIDLLGKRGLAAVLDFPTRIDYLLALIPNHPYTSDEIIDSHTLLPFYEPFFEPGRACEIRLQMKELRDNRLQASFAKNVHRIKSPEYIRFCPRCVEEDVDVYDETYWHRLHQLPGILVCVKHACFLQDSKIRLGRHSSAYFHSAAEFAIPKAPEFVDEKDLTHSTLLELAKNAAWLLSHNELILPPGELRRRYYNLLLQGGYAHYNGKVKTSDFSRELNAYFPQKTLELLGCALRSTPPNWASRLFQKDLIDVLHHPIHHLLVLEFLGISLKEFFTSFTEFKPFGDPPFPCLNAASPHCNELLIEDCKVFDNLTKGEKYRGPLGVFTCTCGFVYQRKGPDKVESDRYRYNSVREYGRQWESKLSGQWQDLNISLAQIARNLNTSACLVTRHAIRLKLPMNGKRSRTAVGYKRYQRPRNLHEKKLLKYRKDWDKLRQANPNASRRALLDKSNHLYQWLKRNDTEWIDSTLPDHGKFWPKKEFLNWKRIDQKLCKKVSVACDQIYNKPGYPVRVCISEILKRVDCKKWIDKRYRKLPSTAVAIDEKIETLEDFMIRKVLWAANEYVKERTIPTQPQFEMRAGTQNRTSKYSVKIQKTIADSMEKIRMAVHKVL